MLNFKGMRFPIDVILVCIRWYAAYPLSYRFRARLGKDVTPAAKIAAHSGSGFCRFRKLSTIYQVNYDTRPWKNAVCGKNLVSRHHLRHAARMLTFPATDLVERTLLGVDHGSGHTGVPQRRGDHAQVLAAKQRCRGEGVAHPVR